MTTLDQLIAGIRQVESGGNYHVVNSIGAVGAYQVMKGNVPSWTKQALGHSMTWQQYRDSPAAQDAVARYMLGRYYAKYGAEGAASMWFSGQPNPNSSRSDGGNTVRQYVNKVMAAAGASGSGYSGGAGGTAAGGGGYDLAPVTPKMDDKTLATYYGLSNKLINSDSSLKKLFKQAVKEGWSPDVFTAHLKNTSWWSKNSTTMRQYLTQKWSDPRTWSQTWAQNAAKVNDLAVQVGLGNLLGKGTTPGKMNSVLEKATYNAYALGWTDAQIKNWLGSQVTTHDGVMWGEAGQAFDALHSAAYANGLTYSTSWYQAAAKAVAGGKSTQEQYAAQIRKAAAAKYKGFAAQINAGMTVMDLANPYISSVSQLLELPSTDVDLTNRYVAKAMTTTQKDGSPYSLYQLENDVRADPTWRKTKNAQDSTMATARSVLTQFGLLS